MTANYQLPTKLTIVIPARNERDGIEGAIRAIPKGELERMGYKVQILVVDNDSGDETGELARKAGAEVVFEPKHGYGSAYKTGFANAKGDIIATADADATYPVEDIPRLVKMLEEENLDFLTTNCFALMEKGAMSFRNKEGIEATIRAIPKAELERKGYEVQILVADSSLDNTAALARKAGAEVVLEPRLG